MSVRVWSDVGEGAEEWEWLAFMGCRCGVLGFWQGPRVSLDPAPAGWHQGEREVTAPQHRAPWNNQEQAGSQNSHRYHERQRYTFCVQSRSRNEELLADKAGLTQKHQEWSWEEVEFKKCGPIRPWQITRLQEWFPFLFTSELKLLNLKAVLTLWDEQSNRHWLRSF